MNFQSLPIANHLVLVLLSLSAVIENTVTGSYMYACMHAAYGYNKFEGLAQPTLLLSPSIILLHIYTPLCDRAL